MRRGDGINEGLIAILPHDPHDGVFGPAWQPPRSQRELLSQPAAHGPRGFAHQRMAEDPIGHFVNINQLVQLQRHAVQNLFRNMPSVRPTKLSIPLAGRLLCITKKISLISRRSCAAKQTRHAAKLEGSQRTALGALFVARTYVTALTKYLIYRYICKKSGQSSQDAGAGRECKKSANTSRLRLSSLNPGQIDCGCFVVTVGKKA